MNKFNKGDQVIWNGRTSELFDEDMTVGETYTVVEDHNEDSIRIKDSDGHQKCFMLKSNFDLSGLKYNNGDTVVVTKNLRGSRFKVTPVVCILSRKTTYDYLATSIDNPSDNWYVADDSLEDYTKPIVADENDSQLEVGKVWLQVATFQDSKGNEITVKRSPCRHYYISVGGEQVRSNIAEVKELLQKAVDNL